MANNDELKKVTDAISSLNTFTSARFPDLAINTLINELKPCVEVLKKDFESRREGKIESDLDAIERAIHGFHKRNSKDASLKLLEVLVTIAFSIKDFRDYYYMVRQDW